MGKTNRKKQRQNVYFFFGGDETVLIEGSCNHDFDFDLFWHMSNNPWRRRGFRNRNNGFRRIASTALKISSQLPPQLHFPRGNGGGHYATRPRGVLCYCSHFIVRRALQKSHWAWEKPQRRSVSAQEESVLCPDPQDKLIPPQVRSDGPCGRKTIS
jgi:hypothetical protein